MKAILTVNTRTPAQIYHGIRVESARVETLHEPLCITNTLHELLTTVHEPLTTVHEPLRFTSTLHELLTTAYEPHCFTDPFTASRTPHPVTP
jgi:hypothetical protein